MVSSFTDRARVSHSGWATAQNEVPKNSNMSPSPIVIASYMNCVYRRSMNISHQGLWLQLGGALQLESASRIGRAIHSHRLLPLDLHSHRLLTIYSERILTISHHPAWVCTKLWIHFRQTSCRLRRAGCCWACCAQTGAGLLKEQRKHVQSFLLPGSNWGVWHPSLEDWHVRHHTQSHGVCALQVFVYGNGNLWKWKCSQ